MAFKQIKIIGDDTAQVAVVNTNIVEAVANGVIAYNTNNTDAQLVLSIDGVQVVIETVPANNSYRLQEKINIPSESTLSIESVTGLDVVVNYFEQAVDSAVALTEAQRLIEQIGLFPRHYEGDTNIDAKSVVLGSTFYNTADNIIYKVVTVNENPSWVQIS